VQKNLSAWQLGGFVFTAVAGTLLHFAYDWSGQSILIAPFSAVNESIAEHMKLLYFPMLVYTLIQSGFLKPRPEGFFCAKLIGTAAGLLLIPVLFYTYTGALGVFSHWFNVTIFFLAAALSYTLETVLLKRSKLPCPYPKVALALLCLIGVAFIVFTFFPIEIPLYQDPNTGLIGRSQPLF